MGLRMVYKLPLLNNFFFAFFWFRYHLMLKIDKKFHIYIFEKNSLKVGRRNEFRENDPTLNVGWLKFLFVEKKLST